MSAEEEAAHRVCVCEAQPRPWAQLISGFPSGLSKAGSTTAYKAYIISKKKKEKSQGLRGRTESPELGPERSLAVSAHEGKAVMFAVGTMSP